LLYTLREV